MQEVRVTWSHSGLKKYEQCPRQYHEVTVLKKYPFNETQATIYGKEVHSAIELYGKGEAEWDARYDIFRPAIDAVLSKPGRKLFEHEMGVTVDLQPCSFNDENRWVRGIADLLIINDDNLTARVVDWKTGSDKYPDTDQLVLMSLMVFAHFPHIRSVSSALMFLVKGSMTKHKMMRDEAPAAWQRYKERVAKIEASHANNVWNPQQSPLCRKHCPVTECSFNG
jgi:hypothetical protein